MNKKINLVITSIGPSTMKSFNVYAAECKKRDIDFIIIGDEKSPEQFFVEGCDYWNINRQKTLPFKLVKNLPGNNYARKNLGYLISITNGTTEIVETDDDNLPLAEFWDEKQLVVNCNNIENGGWVNIYGYFTDNAIWPRGYPLEEFRKPLKHISSIKGKKVKCPIQQGLTDVNPDVDAIYRFIYDLPVKFEKGSMISLGKKTWSPFNSQNIYWFKDAFPLMYLPSYCSFRMTDIWRSFIAQRIAWENGWSILYVKPTVWQERNEHNLMQNFSDEMPGYLNNCKIVDVLEKLNLKRGKENISDNLIQCYEAMIKLNLIDKKELTLLYAWIEDLKFTGKIQ